MSGDRFVLDPAEGFEWDESKRQTNIAKHGIDFVDAVAVFDDPRHTRASAVASASDVYHDRCGPRSRDRRGLHHSKRKIADHLGAGRAQKRAGTIWAKKQRLKTSSPWLLRFPTGLTSSSTRMAGSNDGKAKRTGSD
ncbi:BrnT family toxin [Pseudorhodoplanes sp.]|uniref:BrnT family toxin n=1 Tax=Pseudorhodoplanes sp. TaxID=1934341 RepID=UPI0039C93ECC